MFATRLKTLRAGKMTQEELGKQLGLSKNAVYLYEKGDREPNFETLSQIADYFHVTTDYLLGRSDIPWPYTTGDTQGGMTLTVPNAKKPASEEAGNKTVTVSLDASPFREGLETALLHEYIRRVVAEELAKAQQEK